MANARDERRLAAILAADVVGYSRLMGADESGTLAQMKALRKELIDPKVAEYRGRIVKTTGDGLLIEFPSVIDAVQLAAEIQRAMAARNESIPEDKRIQFRIGVNVGDIIVEGDDIHGDGVNVAARLEGLAKPGGICISRRVHEDVGGKFDLRFDDLGAQKLKNIAEPVQVYRVLLDSGAGGVPTAAKAARQLPWRWVVAAAAVLAVIIGGGAAWNFAIRDDSVPVEVATVADTALPLPDKPSIAVLPFDNLSNDPEQEYFADGMADTLLTDLSRLSGLIVIARNSSFAYKGKAVDVRQVGRELGVKFVLEGSVLRVGDRIRINAQLVDTSTGAHLWAERYDGTMEDVFALQDQVIQQIVSELAIELTGSGEAQVAQNETDDPQAYDAFLQGWELLQRSGPDAGAAAIPYFEQALRIDPLYGRASAALALTYRSAIEQGWWQRLGFTYGETNDKTKEYLARALESPTALAYRVSAQAHLARVSRLRRGPIETAAAEAARAIELEPNNADGYLALAQVLVKSGKHEEALNTVTTAKRLDPQNPQNYDRWAGQAQVLLGRFEDAALTLRQVIELDPEDLWSRMWLGVAYAESGRDDEGRAEIVRLNAMRKERSGQGPISTSVVASFDLHPDDFYRLRNGLNATGVTMVSAPPRAPPGDRLVGEELRAFVRLPWWYGGDPGSGTARWMRFTNQGAVEVGGFWGPPSIVTPPPGIARFRIENDRLCFFGDSPVFCNAVYRNPEGTRTNNDEYLIVGFADSTNFFSAYEERPPALKDKPLKDE